MKYKLSVSITLVVITMFFGCHNIPEKDTEQPYLIVLSLDGFRWDYPEKAYTPTLDSLANAGSRAESIIPCFPTKTFPNHYSIATGLYPDNHGLVLNNFYATDLKREYSVYKRETVQDGAFYGGTPIWNAAESNGIKSATMFWVGSAADINDSKPSIWMEYNKQLSLDSRIDTLVNWLTLPENIRPHFIMWYYYEPDTQGHIHGPNSPQVIEEIEKLDDFLSQFFTAMRKLPEFDKLNFIITSDHGMSEISLEREIFIDHLVDTSLIAFVDGGNPIMNIKAKEGKIDEVYQLLLNSGTNLKAWKHGQLPEHLNYGQNIRTQDITVVADSSWSIGFSWQKYDGRGTHGYDNSIRDMHAIFYASGPAFKDNYLHPQFNNIDIYPLMGNILDIELPANDGNMDNVIDLLKLN